MDKSKFTDSSTGRIVSIPSPSRPSKSDWSFIPDMLPPQGNFDSLWPLLAEACGKLGKLDGIGQTLPHPELLQRPLQEREAIASSRIEGTFVTPQQLMLFMVDQKDRNATRSEMAEWQEVFNCSQALRAGHKLLTNKLPFCDHVLKTMHHTLMQNTQNPERTPGAYRSIQVQIGHNGRFVPPPPIEIAPLLEDLFKFVNNHDDGLHPLVRAFIAYYQFEAIHPFQDGNGRIGRALLALMISRWLEHSMPWLYLSPFFEKYKDEYIDGLFRVSTYGDWSKWIEFCLNGSIIQAEDSIRRCHAFGRAKIEFHANAPQTRRSHDLIEGLFSSPALTIASVMKSSDVSYDTARREIEQLIRAGIIREVGDVHPRTFICDRIMDIAFSDTFSDHADTSEIPEDV